MNTDDFETRLRQFEYFHELRVLPETWVVVRADGRTFSKFTAERFEKPFDLNFSEMMSATAHALLEELHGVFAYTESDEISVLFKPDWAFFDRELEKIVSVSAGIASSTFSLACGERVCFDSRIWVGVTERHVVDYFRWRQADAARCALNGWAYWTLRKEGQNPIEASRALEHQSTEFKNELLFQHGINFNDLPLWQRRGLGLYWETYIKEGFNPIKNETVTAERRRIKVDRELPMKDDYNDFLLDVIRR